MNIKVLGKVIGEASGWDEGDPGTIQFYDVDQNSRRANPVL